MSIEEDILGDLEKLKEDIMKSARVAALGKTEAERVEASKLYDELVKKRAKLQAVLKMNDPTKTDNEVAYDPYTRMDFLEEKMLEAANSGDMALYSTMRKEKKELVREHGRRAPVITSVSAEEITERRRLQAEQNHINRQQFEDELKNPPERSFEDEGDLERQMAEAAERGDQGEYIRLRKRRLNQKQA